MTPNVAKSISNRCFHLLLQKRSLFDVRLTHQSLILPQCSSYARYLRHYSKASYHYISRHPPPSFSPTRSFSSFTSGSKKGLVGWYLGKLQSHPVITKSVTTSIIFIAADLTSQTFALHSSESYDFMRTLRMASYGLLILGPSQHMWFNFVSKVLPKIDVPSTIKKILMGQLLFGPCINSVFFSYNATLQGENGDEIVARLKRDLLPTILNGALYWPICDFVTYKFTPVQLQPLVNSSCAYLWTIYLTFMANRAKVETT